MLDHSRETHFRSGVASRKRALELLEGADPSQFENSIGDDGSVPFTIEQRLFNARRKIVFQAGLTLAHSQWHGGVCMKNLRTIAPIIFLWAWHAQSLQTPEGLSPDQKFEVAHLNSYFAHNIGDPDQIQRDVQALKAELFDKNGKKLSFDEANKMRLAAGQTVVVQLPGVRQPIRIIMGEGVGVADVVRATGVTPSGIGGAKK